MLPSAESPVRMSPRGICHSNVGGPSPDEEINSAQLVYREASHLRRVRGVCRMKLVDPVRRESRFEVSKAVEPELPETLRPVGRA